MNKIIYFKKKLVNNNILIIFSFLVFSLIQAESFLTKNFMIKNWNNIYDINFHITRLIGLNHVLTHPINYLNFGQTGNGTNLFYPWILYYPAKIFSEIFNNYSVGYAFWLIFITFVSFLISFYCGKSFFNSTKAGYLFSIVYVFSNTRIQVGYVLSDLGQFTAMTFLPLVLFYWYKIVFKKENDWVGWN